MIAALVRTSAFTVMMFVACGVRAHAQDESRRIKSGQVKVGDRIEANPTYNGAWANCTVLQIVPDPVRAGYDGDYVIQCDNSYWNRVSATGDHARLAARAPAAQPAATPATATPPQPMAATARPAAPAAQAPIAAPGRAPAGGNAFGTRDPRPCPSVTGGTPSPAAAAQLVACSIEGLSRQNTEYIAGAVTVRSMAASRYNPYTQTGFTDMDTGVNPVEIRGSAEMWSCSQQDGPGVMPQYSNVGHNCTHMFEPNANGYCYKMRNGNWNCSMRDTSGTRQSQYNVPPPR